MPNRKRYEITCDTRINPTDEQDNYKFQYRKRYEITCDNDMSHESRSLAEFQYRKRYEITCDTDEKIY